MDGHMEQNAQLNNQQENEEDAYYQMQMQQINEYYNHNVNLYQRNYQENDEELIRALAESEEYYQKEQMLKKTEEKNSKDEDSIRIPVLQSTGKQKSSKTSTKELEEFYIENYAKSKQRAEQQHKKEVDAFNEIRTERARNNSEESNAIFDYLTGREVPIKESSNVQAEKYKRYKQENGNKGNFEANESDIKKVVQILKKSIC